VKAIAIAVAAGALFACGLVVSGMTEPAKVIGFLDVTGRHGGWDPSLAFVMAGAIAVYAPLARFARSRTSPMFDRAFHWPTATVVDRKLVLGAIVFGVGWGLSGYCPGPAVTSLVGGAPSAVVFVAAMVAGMALARAGTRAR
jgi:uncharacterized protein